MALVLKRNNVLEGEGQVGFHVATYDTSRTLIIDPLLVYSTYLGGGDYDNGSGIAVDDAGYAYVTGYTRSADFPTTQDPIGGGGGDDVFVTKLSPDGALIYCTTLGGSDLDGGKHIAVDDSGHAYVAGDTYSDDFPTESPYQGVYRGRKSDAFVTKLSSDGSKLVYSTYLGGGNWDVVSGIAVDGSGNVYVSGHTNSPNFPTESPYQGVHGGGEWDVFVTKLSADGSKLVYSTYLGGSSSDAGRGIAVDESGNACVMGDTYSTDFPTESPYQGVYGGEKDVFVTKLSSDGSALVYSTYLGGSSRDYGEGIAVDGSGNAYVTGYTRSTDFPTESPYQEVYGGGEGDAFVTKLSPDGSALVYSTYLGGGSGDEGAGIAVDGSGNAYVMGDTESTDFPTESPYQEFYRGGSSDAFVTKLLGEASPQRPKARRR